ncbi:hypothetical protein ACIQVE_01745 [Pseudomonas sp. NPDC098747]|uniref:hypothetical protein n=1 Tax=Pseudomonas sp. NPDC098747 TaxID=3364487 RepID=UPI00383AEDEF
MNIKILLGLLACAALTGCSDPKDFKLGYAYNPITDDAQLKAAIARLTKEEQQLFGGYAVRSITAAAFGKSVESVQTIGEAISAQRHWINERGHR